MQNIVLDNLLLIDIETVPEHPTFDLLTDGWKQLWEEKTQRSLPDFTTAAEFYPQRAGVMAEFAKIVCISIGYFTRQGTVLQLRLKSFYRSEERRVGKEC